MAAEVEELLAYAADTMNSEQLEGLDIDAIVRAILTKLTSQQIRRPGQPLRLLFLSTKVTKHVRRYLMDSLKNPNESLKNLKEPASRKGRIPYFP